MVGSETPKVVVAEVITDSTAVLLHLEGAGEELGIKMSLLVLGGVVEEQLEPGNRVQGADGSLGRGRHRHHPSSLHPPAFQNPNPPFTAFSSIQ